MGADLAIRKPIRKGRSLGQSGVGDSPAQISQLSTVLSLTCSDHEMITRRSTLNRGCVTGHQDRGMGRTPGMFSRIR